MARNEEKALTLFNKWHTFKKDFHAGSGNRRPLVSSECQSLPEAEKFRRDVIRDITKKIAMIQNASLGEHRIRELNDEINKLVRNKHYWEIRIRELGGSDYKKGRTQFYEIEGKELPGAPNYKYYGAASELPGVRELFAELEERADNRKNNKSRGDLYKNVTPDYYGYRDDDDGVLAAKEADQEKINQTASVQDFLAKKRKLQEDVRRSGGVFGKEDYLAYLQGASEAEDDEDIAGHQGQGFQGQGYQGQGYQSPFVPSTADLQQQIVEQKRLQLLERYL